MRQFATIIFSLSCIVANSQLTHKPLNAVYTETGAYSGLHTDVFSFSANQASLAGLNKFSAGLYGEKRFMLNQLSSFFAAMALPTAAGNFGVRMNYFGDAAYQEMQGGLAYGRKLGEKVSAGVQFNYYSVGAGSYGKATSVNFEGGLLFHFTSKFHGGVHVYNPTGSVIGKNKEEKLPSIYSAGFGYDASEQFFISTIIEKEEDQEVGVRASMQYKFDDKVLARGGVVTATSTYFFGVGVMLKGFRLDATASVHPNLGVTPGLMVVFKNGEDK